MSLQGRLTDAFTAVGAYIKASVMPRLLPTGGSTGQVVAKTSGGYGWVDPAEGESELGAGPIDVLGSVRRPANAIGALTVDCSLGNAFGKTISTNSTFVFSNAPPSGRDYSFKLIVDHTAGTITWPASVVWPGGAAPSLTTGKKHLFWFTTNNGGTTWRGACLADYAS